MASPLAGPSPLRDELGRLLAPGSALSKRIEFVSRRLARIFRLGQHGREDLAQDLAVHLFKILHKFNPDRGVLLETFMLGVIRRWYPWRAREFRRQAERESAVGSRDVAWVTTDEVPGSRCAFDLVTTRIDLDTVIAGLPPEMAALARLLARCTVSQIAELNEEHRTTIWRKVQRIREHIEKNFPDSDSNPRNTSA